MDNIVDKIIALHDALQSAELPHAFGGALALAWCTRRARGTIDVDVNVLIPAEAYQRALDALPDAVIVTRKDLGMLKRDGQARFWWQRTPIDLFLNTTTFHEQIIDRIRWETFAGRTVPFLACYDLAVFKAFFNRTKDWADLEEMYAAGTLDIPRVQAALIHYLGIDDPRIPRIGSIASNDDAARQ